MIQSGVVPVDQLWRSIRREAESAVARDPVFGAALSSAILDHPDFASALAHQIGARLGKGPADRRAVCANRRRSVCRLARTDRCGEPRSAEHRRSRSRDDDAAAAAVELQGLRRAAGLARLQLALAPAPQRSRAAAAKPVVRSASGFHSSVGIDRHVGVSRSRHRHHHRRLCRDRRRGDDPAKRHHRPKTVRARPRAENRQRRLSRRRIDHYRRCQHRRFRQGRRRRGRRA